MTISDERLEQLLTDRVVNLPHMVEIRDALRELQRRRHVSGPMAPIARVSVDGDGWAANCAIYAPGLPPGEHDLYPEPPQRDDAPIVRGELRADLVSARYEHEAGDCSGGP